MKAAIAALILLCGAVRAEVTKSQVLVAVASNFKETQDEIAAAFKAKTNIPVESSAGSTGKLYAQTLNGAPWQIFLSADREHADKLEAAGATAKDARFTYAVGKLVLYSPALPGVQEGALLKADALKHLATADPETAPYGAAAMFVLKALGLMDRLQPKLVQGENIAQTFQFIDSGAAEAGLIALAQVMKRPADHYWVIPEKLYPPIEQDAVLLKVGNDNPAAKAYFEFLRGPEARAIIERAGYAVPK